MDQRLVAWARSVKSRRRFQAPHRPPLWLFTDAARMPDLATVVGTLPKGLCGVVFRHDAVPGRARLARAVARICRDRRLAMAVAGQTVPLPGIGAHRRAGRGWGPGTASAHDVAELIRASRSGAGIVFLSPVFPTRSHDAAPVLGVLRWAAMARGRGPAVLALGGVDGTSVRRLPRWCAGAGAIGALLS